MIDISPRRTYERLLRSWWVITIGLILGGLAGWLYTRFQPPVYEATAAYDVSLDQQQIAARLNLGPEKLPLVSTAQNVYLAPVVDVFDAPGVRARLVNDANAQGIKLQDEDVNGENFYLDRRGVRWFLSVRNTDPVAAAKLANLWLAAADPVIREAQAHTAQSRFLQLQRDAIQKCFSEMDFTRANQCAGTAFSAPSALEEYLNSLEQQISSEAQAGRSIDPAITFVVGRQAEPPSQPILYNTSLIILAGSLIGLLVGILAVSQIKVVKP